MKGGMDPIRVGVLFSESNDEPAHDVVVDQVADALRAGGHDVRLVGVQDDVRALLDRLEAEEPELVFNLCESFAGRDSSEKHVVALLEVLGYRFTGAGSTGLALREDKAITKKILAFHEIRTPDYAILSEKTIELAGKMAFPLFVKPLHGDGSVGVGQQSLVADYTSLVEQVDRIHRELHDAALVEEYIEGREFYVGVLGNDPIEALPLIELDFSQLPTGYQRIYDRKAKAAEDSVQYNTIREIAAIDLSPETRSRLTTTGLAAARAMQMTDYARVDLRMTLDGTPYVVEVNANPYLKDGDTLAMAARQAGLEYPQLVGRILEAAHARWALPGPARKKRARAKKATAAPKKAKPEKQRRVPVRAGVDREGE